eukprot:snap_masked-scaffold_37-processed-gene-0.12-mRNA-1 protein AED:0.06 eAED:0.07 QI:0/0/0/1/1/1/3/0/4292
MKIRRVRYDRKKSFVLKRFLELKKRKEKESVSNEKENRRNRYMLQKVYGKYVDKYSKEYIEAHMKKIEIISWKKACKLKRMRYPTYNQRVLFDCLEKCLDWNQRLLLLFKCQNLDQLRRKFFFDQKYEVVVSLQDYFIYHMQLQPKTLTSFKTGDEVYFFDVGSLCFKNAKVMEVSKNSGMVKIQLLNHETFNVFFGLVYTHFNLVKRLLQFRNLVTARFFECEFLMKKKEKDCDLNAVLLVQDSWRRKWKNANQEIKKEIFVALARVQTRVEHNLLSVLSSGYISKQCKRFEKGSLTSFGWFKYQKKEFGCIYQPTSKSRKRFINLKRRFHKNDLLNSLKVLRKFHSLCFSWFRDQSSAVCLFCKVVKPLTIEEFTKIQNRSVYNCSSFVREEMILKFRKVLSFLPKSKEFETRSYMEYTKCFCKRFTMMLNFRLADALNRFVCEQVASLLAEIGRFDTFSFSIKDPRTIYSNPSLESRNGLFTGQVLVSADDDSGGCNISYEILPTVLTDVIESLLQSVQAEFYQVDRLEKGLFSRIYFETSTFLNVFHEAPPLENWVQKSVSSVLSGLSLVTKVLQYLDDFSPVLSEDPTHLLDSLEAVASSDENAVEVVPNSTLSTKLEEYSNFTVNCKKMIEKSVSMGLFSVNMENVRRTIHLNCSEMLNGMLKFSTANIALQMEKFFVLEREVLDTLNRFPQSVEDCFELEKYITNLDNVTALIQPYLDLVEKNTAILRSFFTALPKDLFFSYLKATQCKSKLETVAQEVLRCIQEEKERYLRNQISEQNLFNGLIAKMDEEVNQFLKHDNKNHLEQIMMECNLLQEKIKNLQEKALLFNTREELYGRKPTSYDSIEEIEKKYEPMKQFWTCLFDWTTKKTELTCCAVSDVSYPDTEDLINNLIKVFGRCFKLFSQRTDEAGSSGSESVLFSNLKDIASEAKNSVSRFRPNLELFNALSQPGFNNNHWEVLFEKLDNKIDIEVTVPSLQNLSKLDLLEANNLEIVKSVGILVSKETQIKKMLDKMKGEWEALELEIVPYKETGTSVLKGVEEPSSLLDEHISQVQTLQFSPFKGSFSEEIDAFALELQTASEALEGWISVQKNWLYLQPIFDSPDINKQLPIEGKKFQEVDQNWRQTVAAAKDKKVLAFCGSSQLKLVPRFREMERLLDEVSKGLSEYLETKRGGFARFYFLSNDELLEILSETKDPEMVQPHLKKCFEGIKFVKFSVLEDANEILRRRFKTHDVNKCIYSKDLDLSTIIYQADGLAILDDLRNEALQNFDIPKPYNLTSNNRTEKVVTHMISSETETVELSMYVNPKNKTVEFWMTQLENFMIETVKFEIFTSIKSYIDCKRTAWLQKVPGQCALNASQFHWTKCMEMAMTASGNKGIQYCLEMQKFQINDLVTLVRSPNLGSLGRMTVSALTVLDVHARDVTQKLFDEGVSEPSEFLWISQMRYYWEFESRKKTTKKKKKKNATEDVSIEQNVLDYTSGTLMVRMVSAVRPYGYEYLGNSFRLVITPLTDKCYLTLMNAMQMTLGGAPAGPAGTGKTETTKDLAKALAKQCVVFNCSDGLDYLAMGKFFKGLASCGAWACFDEFNRIDVEVLSVVAQQIMTLQGGVISGKTRIVFEGTEINLSSQFAVFITMNPGYAGRTELPDNLKARFRPVAMMVPDYALIGEIMLYSFGYDNAKDCAKKMVATFRLCSEQLSSQSHYDYGMRAVKTVIVAAGNLKAKKENQSVDEEVLLLIALQDVNIPKFLRMDIPLFKGIMSDLFPGKSKPFIDYSELYLSLRESNYSNGLQSSGWFLQKQIQLYEMIIVRHGLMLVGPSGGGKTSNLANLCSALTSLKAKGIQGFAFEVIELYTLNPKSVTMGQLYGEFDANTHEWQDGVLAEIMRQCIKSITPNRKFVMFDGPVDAIWIENMNTVLDDNKKLCLNSGEIMSLSAEMTMMFEVEDLDVASPATVSRVGIIYMEPQSLGYSRLIESYIQFRMPYVFDPMTKASVFSFLDRYLDSWFIFLKNLTQPVNILRNFLLESFFKIFHCCLLASFSYGLKEDVAGLGLDQEGQRLKKEGLELGPFCKDFEISLPEDIDSNDILCLAWFSFIWGCASTVDDRGRLVFNQWFKNKIVEENVELPFLLDSTSSVYDYMYDVKQHSWILWMKSVEPYSYDKSLSFANTVVPTKESVCYAFLLDTLVPNGVHVLMSGPTGTGKSVNISKYLGNMDIDTFIPLTMAFSAQTSVNQTQDFLDSKMEKLKRGVFGPPSGKRFVIFVDDLNMPQREEYFAQPPLELLRQYFDYSGWYDRKILSFRNIVNCCFLSAMGPPGGGRNEVSQRILRHFCLINYVETSDKSLFVIFHTILQNFLLHNGFKESLTNVADKIVKSSINVYFRIKENLLPTPQKSFYTFNLRDISKVFQGTLLVKARNCPLDLDLFKLWIHEINRVFGDRLINNEDRNWFSNLLGSTLVNFMHTEQDFANEISTNKLLCFSDILDPVGKEYKFVPSVSSLIEAVNQYLSDYNSESQKQMNLKLFTEAVLHVSRICRVLVQPGGNVLLLGVGGSGRKSLTTLSCYVCGLDLFFITITKTYNLKDWREDVKSCIMNAGLKKKGTVFLFDDTQIVFSQMLEDLNGLLNSGDIPNLYAPEEIEKIGEACRPDCVKAQIAPTKLNVFAQYLSRVKDNFHCVTCLSPGTEVFRDRVRMFPSLVNCCTIDWFNRWPSEALKAVGSGLVAEQAGNLELHESIYPKLVEMFQTFHSDVGVFADKFFAETRRAVYITPTSFLELIKTFTSLYVSQKQFVLLKTRRLEVGMLKLRETEAVVSDLQNELTEMQPKLKETQIEVEKMIKVIEVDKVEADATKVKVIQEEKIAGIKAKETQAIAASAQAELDEALPALDEALKCLNKLKKSDLDEVRSLKKPPAGVKLTMEVACIMFVIKPDMIKDPDTLGKKIKDYWGPAQAQLLNDPNKLLLRLFNFDKDNIPDKVISQMDSYIEMPEFTPKEIEKASKACTAICMWATAMYSYHYIKISVEPKKQKLKAAEAELNITLEKLKAQRDILEEVTRRIKSLEGSYNQSLQKKISLAEDVETCSNRLVRAESLIGGLSGEKARWIELIAQYKMDLENLVGNIVLAAGNIAYLGPFTSAFREELNTQWKLKLQSLDIPNSGASASFATILGDPVEINNWQVLGLPSDALSTENALVIFNSERYSLIIDPQSQANKFLRNLGAQRSAKQDAESKENTKSDLFASVKANGNNLVRMLESSMRFGKWLLLEDVTEKIDPVLDPVLLRQFFIQDGQRMIKLGENAIPVDDNFKLFLTTRLSNPHYPPDVSVKITLINFCITSDGLEEQLLGLAMKNELPELETKKQSLLQENAEMNLKLKEIENTILHMLSASEGNILDDVELIDVLSKSKVTSQEIMTRVKESKVIQGEINTTRENFRTFAKHSSNLFFCVASLRQIESMYEYSLQWFKQLFVKSIFVAEPCDNFGGRTTNLKKCFTFLLFENVSRSLFEKHKLLFAFHLCNCILSQVGELSQEQYRFLLSGQVSKSNPEKLVKPTEKHQWLTEIMCLELNLVFSLVEFAEVKRRFVEEISHWKNIYLSENCYKEEFPPSGTKLTLLEKMCMIRCLRPDKVGDACVHYISEKLDARFVESLPFDLSKSFSASDVFTPLILLLSAGSDPTKDFYDFANSVGFGEKVMAISLGQGQGPVAERMIEESRKNGSWVLLQNCHLCASWLETLERKIEEVDKDNTNENYRLWLTTMPLASFPVAILQNGIKITKEPPQGLKFNLKAVYHKFTDSELTLQDWGELLTDDDVNNYNKLLFGLCFFHALIQERRKFGPLGWNIPYEFNDTDLDISMKQLNSYMKEYREGIPFEVLNFLTSYINYGGRVTDAIDLRTIDRILKTFYCKKILLESYIFSPSGVYKSVMVNEDNPKGSILDQIEKLPLVSEPEIFFLHKNANITFALNNSVELLENLMALQSQGSSKGASNREEIVLGEIDLVDEWLKKTLVDLDYICLKFPTDYHESMNTVLNQESARVLRLVETMKSNLENLKKALKGISVLSTDLDEMASSIFMQKVPGPWESVSYPSLKPWRPWLVDLRQRIAFFDKWVENGTPKTFWISSFFFPQAFLTGQLQNYARRNKLPIDTVSYGFNIMKESKGFIEKNYSTVLKSIGFQDSVLDGCFVHGLFMEGGRFDLENMTVTSSRERELYTDMPVIHFEAIRERVPPIKNIYLCPIYKILSRRGTLSTTGHSTNFVMWIELPSKVKDSEESAACINNVGRVDDDRWIKAGVAAFCSLRY